MNTLLVEFQPTNSANTFLILKNSTHSIYKHSRRPMCVVKINNSNLLLVSSCCYSLPFGSFFSFFNGRHFCALLISIWSPSEFKRNVMQCSEGFTPFDRWNKNYKFNEFSVEMTLQLDSPLPFPVTISRMVCGKKLITPNGNSIYLDSSTPILSSINSSKCQ